MRLDQGRTRDLERPFPRKSSCHLYVRPPSIDHWSAMAIYYGLRAVKSLEPAAAVGGRRGPQLVGIPIKIFLLRPNTGVKYDTFNNLTKKIIHTYVCIRNALNSNIYKRAREIEGGPDAEKKVGSLFGLMWMF